MSNVLLVHADPALGAKLAAAIARTGHEIRVVTSGERAMDRFIQEPADVVVVDYDLDGRDGLSTAEAIRWMPGGRRARVVLTAAAEPQPTSLEELGRSIDAFAAVVGPPDALRLAALVDSAAAVRPHDAETRVLAVEQALLAAESARSRPALACPPERSVGSRAEPASAAEFDDRTLERDDESSDWEWRDTDGRVEGREVRAMAEAAEQTASELVGTLDVMPFARVLHRLASKRATGALICVHPPDGRSTTEAAEPTKIVYFRAGVPVHVQSNLVDECLGQVLVRQGKIGPATLHESLSALERGEGRQGDVLVEMGALGPLDLSEALAEQLRVKLFDLFGWLRGTFRFAAGRAPATEVADLGLGLAEIAYLGVREGMRPSRVLERLAPHLEQLVVPRPRELVRFVRLHVPAPLREVIRAVDGTHRLRELLAMSDDPADAAQLVHAMQCLDAVRFEDALALAPAPLEPAPSAAHVYERAEPTGAPGPPDAPWSGEAPRPRPAQREAPHQAASTASEAHLLTDRVERLLAAERHFRRGQRALDRAKSDEAVGAFARAAELCPDEGQFLVYLGWAKHAAAPDDAFVLSEALDLAQRGCRAAPELPVAHLLRARLLKAASRDSDARVAFGRVLELDAGNAEAAQAARG